MIWANTIKLNNTTISVLIFNKEYRAKEVSIQHKNYVILVMFTIKWAITIKLNNTTISVLIFNKK
jgi:hypothetical protein